MAIFFTSCEARRYGQWEYENWWDFVRAEQMSQDYRKQLADGLTRNLAAAKPKEMSVNSTGIVGESFAYSLLYRPRGTIRPSPQRPHQRGLDRPLGRPPAASGCASTSARRRSACSIRRRRGFDPRPCARATGARGAVEADWFVCAMPVERARRLFEGEAMSPPTPALGRLRRIRTEWMNGVIFHLDREVPVAHGHVSYVDSPFALTSISQAQHWKRDIAQRVR